MIGAKNDGSFRRGALGIDFRSPWPWIGASVLVLAAILGSVWQAVSSQSAPSGSPAAAVEGTASGGGAPLTAVTKPGEGGLGYSAPPKGTPWPAAEPLDAPVPSGPPTGNPNVPPAAVPAQVGSVPAAGGH